MGAASDLSAAGPHWPAAFVVVRSAGVGQVRRRVLAVAEEDERVGGSLC